VEHLPDSIDRHSTDNGNKAKFRNTGVMNDLHERLTTFLNPYVSNERRYGKPVIILTWAQSLDAKIAPGSRTPIALSSLETKYMTHLIRRQTDAILIGAETAVTDNPSLNGMKLL